MQTTTNPFVSRFILLLSLVLIMASCEKNPTATFTILPTPTEFEVSGSSSIGAESTLGYLINENIESPPSVLLGDLRAEPAGSSEPQLILELDESMDISSEGYTLSISDSEIRITGKDEAGIFYGVRTLEQLVVDAKEQNVPLPTVEIKDVPKLAYRAMHLDMKHHMEKLEYYYSLIDQLAGYKVNTIIAEVEDKIQYVRQPKVGSEDALSIEEWVKLSDYAKARFIEISPLVQGLGHASFILKHEEYVDLRDDPTNDWAFNPLDERTYEVQFDLYKDAIEATPHGRYLHVGGDEVHTTGRNSGRSALELQLDWLNRVCAFAEENNRIPIFWDDMPLKHAGVYRAMYQPELTQEEVDSVWKEGGPKLEEFLDDFPKNCIYMRWNYSFPQSLGNIKTMNWFRENGLQVMGATAGQQRWVLMPQNQGNIESIRSFALSSINSELNGLLLTLWDDDSPHFELYWRGILAFAEYTWAGERISAEEYKNVYRRKSFSIEASEPEYTFIDDLEEPVGFWKNALVQGNNRNHISRLSDPLNDAAIGLPDIENPGRWSNTYDERLDQAKLHKQSLDSILIVINQLKTIATRNQYRLQIYEQVAKTALLGMDILIELEEFDLSETKDFQALKDLNARFLAHREEMEEVYSKTRVLTKPDSYLLDQDHHVHLANQSTSFDWQFGAELLLFEKIEKELLPREIELN